MQITWDKIVPPEICFQLNYNFLFLIINWLKKFIGQSVELKGPRENKERRSKPAFLPVCIQTFGYFLNRETPFPNSH